MILEMLCEIRAEITGLPEGEAEQTPERVRRLQSAMEQCEERIAKLSPKEQAQVRYIMYRKLDRFFREFGVSVSLLIKSPIPSASLDRICAQVEVLHAQSADLRYDEATRFVETLQ